MKPCVYRMRAADGTLLYVGMTTMGSGRFDAHRSANWWPQVATIEIDHHETRREAYDAEGAAILAEQPVHNIQCKIPRRALREVSA